MPKAAFATTAERSVELIKKTGERVPLTISIGVPYPSGDAWYCGVILEGWGGSPPDTWGRDSYGALIAAMTLVRSVLATFLTAGGRIVFPSSDTDMEMIDFTTGQFSYGSDSEARNH